MRFIFGMAVALAIILFPPSALADEATSARSLLERMFKTGEAEPEWFAQDFLAQVPAERVSEIVSALREQHGPFQSVEGQGQNYTVTLERAEVPTRIVLDAEGRIAGLLFQPVAAGTISEQVEAIADLPGQTAVLVVSNGAERATHNAGEPLAVGSTAKLAILKALAGAYEEGSLGPQTVVSLDPEWKSLPSGILQDWPDGSPLTVATLAKLMISISDNTATDALIRLVGRQAVEAEAARNVPFLTTRELFILKGAGNAELRDAWVEASAEGRRDILEQIASSPLPEKLATEPTVDIEWFFSARELCDLMEAVASLPPLHINPGLAEPERWQRVAYKGGSEAGVLNFTTWAESADGDTHCVVATWNDEAALDEQKLAGSYRAILRSLREDN